MNRPAPVVTTLHPGDVALAERGDRLETLLGSCVAIVLTDPRRTVGVMCHVVHSRAAAVAARDTGAHAETAMAAMEDLLQARGITLRLCQAYVYGGGDMFPHLAQRLNVGNDNADWALAALQQRGIHVLAHDVGGTVYRRIGWTVGPDAPDVVASSI